MNTFLTDILLGVIEGITEFLPISSTGHLLIAEHWLAPRSELFNVVIQAGAILAVTAIYWPRIWQLLTGWREPAQRDYLLKLFVAFLITSTLGFIVVSVLKFKLAEALAPVAWALLIGGVWMLIAERLVADQPDRQAISWRVAILVGLAQIVAGIFPGTSRSAATIFIAMLAGTSNRAAATEFAFLVGIPTMYAASAYELLKCYKAGALADENWSSVGVAFVVSTITAFIAVKWLLGYIRSHRFTAFAVYRIVLGAGLLMALATGIA